MIEKFNISDLCEHRLQSIKQQIHNLEVNMITKPSVELILTNGNQVKDIINKKQFLEQLGIKCNVIDCSWCMSTHELIECIDDFNKLSSTTSIYVQTPLKGLLNPFQNNILNSINWKKDISCVTQDRIFRCLTSGKLNMLPLIINALLYTLENKNVLVINDNHNQELNMLSYLRESQSGITTFVNNNTYNIECLSSDTIYNCIIVSSDKQNVFNYFDHGMSNDSFGTQLIIDLTNSVDVESFNASANDYYIINKEDVDSLMLIAMAQNALLCNELQKYVL